MALVAHYENKCKQLSKELDAERIQVAILKQISAEFAKYKETENTRFSARIVEMKDQLARQKEEIARLKEQAMKSEVLASVVKEFKAGSLQEAIRSVKQLQEADKATTCKACRVDIIDTVLGCGHTLCIGCFHTIKDKNTFIICPVCRAKSHQRPADAFHFHKLFI